MLNFTTAICGITCLSFYLLSYMIYVTNNQGLPHQARGLQLRRFFFASLFVFLPLLFSQTFPFSASILWAMALSVLWMVTHLRIYYLCNKEKETEIDHYFDVAFGLYLFGLLTSGMILGSYLGLWGIAVRLLVAVVEFVLALIPLFQIAYYLIYQVNVDSGAMECIIGTDYNETLEYLRSLPARSKVGAVVAVSALLVLCVGINIGCPVTPANGASWVAVLSAVLGGVFALYLFKPRKGAFFRTGMMWLYIDVKTYMQDNGRYARHQQQRMSALQVEPLTAPSACPHTMLLVIGESATRDYMSAFTPMTDNTTPWLSECKLDEQHFLLFGNAYSCATQTVPVLERALTERNQYNDKTFLDSCSIVDVAHKLGYKVHWYSNQGHLGITDTPITLVANTADEAKWTNQELNKVQYDDALLDFVKEVNPQQNNLVVLHLMGSHFNYMSRNPASFTRWGQPGVQNQILNYENTICYTDNVLKQVYEYASQNLNLQSMVYFSDHGTIPDKRRSPDFKGFGMVRIPLFVYLSDEYRQQHPARYAALSAHRNSYFTDDLIYELVCGLLDVKSNCYDELNSLASDNYQFTRDNLLTNEGRIHIKEDEE